MIFIKNFPTIQKLAKASDEKVMKLWEGLGYYSRCRNLLATARFITEELNGKFPASYNEIKALKGVGPYTAAAIASFAYNLPYAVLDGNVYRVLARFFGVDTAVDTTAGKASFSALAQSVLEVSNPALYNQAIMDFGATICKPLLPLCAICMLKEHCVAFKHNKVAALPVKEKKMLKKKRWFFYLHIERKNRVLVGKRTLADIWQNLHEFYLVEGLSTTEIDSILTHKKVLALRLKNAVIKTITQNRRQQLTHQTIHAAFIHLQCDSLAVPHGMEMVEKNHMLTLAFPKIINEYMGLLTNSSPDVG